MPGIMSKTKPPKITIPDMILIHINGQNNFKPFLYAFLTEVSLLIISLYRARVKRVVTTALMIHIGKRIKLSESNEATSSMALNIKGTAARPMIRLMFLR